MLKVNFIAVVTFLLKITLIILSITINFKINFMNLQAFALMTLKN
ncbi:294R [Invertebrate iridescent virus Kaz2018]|uniref:294R n=1 Tax=Invertebrate iridescent virus 6 TaxID=176652 RepID=Q91FN0_IIV6|nr:294R [Invertebrate iridescent virus 6]AAK82155.1 294R [Invertebrate iridescent virus 6]QMS79735.1 hypothetical protein IIV6-T1_288 [Invertebrate iridescent virus 6]QNH08704.1 294R [Invertebrate iridescent virus Kaz2018]